LREVFTAGEARHQGRRRLAALNAMWTLKKGSGIIFAAKDNAPLRQLGTPLTNDLNKTRT
jgi:hypothetical protein